MNLLTKKKQSRLSTSSNRKKTKSMIEKECWFSFVFTSPRSIKIFSRFSFWYFSHWFVALTCFNELHCGSKQKTLVCFLSFFIWFNLVLSLSLLFLSRNHPNWIENRDQQEYLTVILFTRKGRLEVLSQRFLYLGLAESMTIDETVNSLSINEKPNEITQIHWTPMKKQRISFSLIRI